MANILLIEDDEAVRTVISKMLTREGHRVIEAENGRAGLSAFYEESPDLVITDIIMPDQEGIEVICEVKRAKPATRVLAISGGGLLHNQDYCLRAAQQLGADSAMPKPFTRVELLNTVDTLLALNGTV